MFRDVGNHQTKEHQGPGNLSYVCRTPWQGDDDTVKKTKNKGIIGSDGYVNVADQLGISRRRVPTMMDRIEV
ncbi:uncharacterized protein F4817DRAFT_320686 [Daldinia loculata]|uniref:uncharacterized protein n=1 Tax=Daldinia loculata TaxID=103429 RepID=UPI0020C25384|nr:uncharacterized protein F4817DRAFT_320686 [Daldinia loculata]KAI1642568.1 hypothetical protein F4817DRAFT_320686 [Daldinia loculata]